MKKSVTSSASKSQRKNLLIPKKAASSSRKSFTFKPQKRAYDYFEDEANTSKKWLEFEQIVRLIQEEEKAKQMANIQSGLQAQTWTKAQINAAQAAVAPGWVQATNGNYYAPTTYGFGQTVSFSPKAKGQMDEAEEAHKMANVTAKELLHDINAMLSTIKALRGT